MAAPVISLVERTRKAECNAETVKLLEQWLDKARAGEIVSVAFAAVGPDGSAYTEVTSSIMFVTLLGAVGRLWHQLNLVGDREASA